MKPTLFICLIYLLSFSNYGKCQENIHVSIWQDEYTIIRHLPAKLNNLIGQYDYLQYWNATYHTYISYVPIGLTYDQAANKTVFIEQIETGYSFKDHFQNDWKNFSDKKMDSLFHLKKTNETTKLTYNQIGQLIRSDRSYKSKKKI